MRQPRQTEIMIRQFIIWGELTETESTNPARVTGIDVQVKWQPSQNRWLGPAGVQHLGHVSYDGNAGDLWADIKAEAKDLIGAWVGSLPTRYGMSKKQMKPLINGLFTKYW